MPAVALNVLPIYKTRFDREAEVELLTSASPWLSHHVIVSAFLSGKSKISEICVNIEDDWSQKAWISMCFTQATPKPY